MRHFAALIILIALLHVNPAIAQQWETISPPTDQMIDFGNLRTPQDNIFVLGWKKTVESTASIT